MKIVINDCHGGFSLSKAALERLKELKQKDALTEDVDHYERSFHSYCRDIPRDDPLLVQVVEELGTESYGGYAELKIVEIPDGVEWEVKEYDGAEWVAEKHRTWG